MAAGDLSTAGRRALPVRAPAAGRRPVPRNSLVNGKQAPDTEASIGSNETAYPILMAYQAGLQHDASLWADHIRKAADFVVAHGPSFGSEQWGRSPAATHRRPSPPRSQGWSRPAIADVNGDHAPARVYRATADHFQRGIKGWTVTTTGPYASGRYFIRLAKNGDPNQAVTYNLGNGGPKDQPARGHRCRVPRADPARHPPRRRRRCAAVTACRRRRHPPRHGQRARLLPLRHRHSGHRGASATARAGRRRLLAQRQALAHRQLGLRARMAGTQRRARRAAPADRLRPRTAARLLLGMQRFASGIGLVPEQAWEKPGTSGLPLRHHPRDRVHRVRERQVAAGSASPLTWAQAQQVQGHQSLGRSRPVEQPRIVRTRYQPTPPPVAPVKTSPRRPTAPR